MNREAATWSNQQREPQLGDVGFAPMLPVTLLIERAHSVEGLLDTGATVNVLPFSLGLQLGGRWDAQTVPINLTGNLALVEARGLLVQATIGDFAPVTLGFAWSKSDDVPLLFGQVNFFQLFDVCFFRSRLLFEVRPK